MAKWLLNNAEELAEGALLGLMTAGAVLPQDETLAAKAMQVAGAATIGVGAGIGARHLGARLGRRWHGNELAEGPVRGFARSMGSESIVGGLGAQGRAIKETIERDLRQNTAKRLVAEALEDPANFTRTYGIDADGFLTAAERIAPLQGVSAAASALRDMTPAQRQRFRQTAKEVVPEDVRRLFDADDLVAREASQRIERQIREVADELGKRYPEGLDINHPDAAELRSVLGPIGKLFEGQSLTAEKVLRLLDPAEPVTGEHLGRAIGRFAGDEIGAIGGQALGLMLAQSLGWARPREPVEAAD